jgi:hypothetical protein
VPVVEPVLFAKEGTAASDFDHGGFKGWQSAASVYG